MFVGRKAELDSLNKSYDKSAFQFPVNRVAEEINPLIKALVLRHNHRLRFITRPCRAYLISKEFESHRVKFRGKMCQF